MKKKIQAEACARLKGARSVGAGGALSALFLVLICFFFWRAYMHTGGVRAGKRKSGS